MKIEISKAHRQALSAIKQERSLSNNSKVIQEMIEDYLFRENGRLGYIVDNKYTVTPDQAGNDKGYNMPTKEELDENKKRFHIAVANAKKILQPGDRVRVTKCPGTKRTITFAGWDGPWIVSKSGINDYAASCVDMVNGKIVDFGRE